MLRKYWVRLRQNNSLSWTDNKNLKILRWSRNRMSNLSCEEVEMTNFSFTSTWQQAIICFSAFRFKIDQFDEETHFQIHGKFTLTSENYRLQHYSSKRKKKKTIMKCMVETRALTLRFKAHAAEALFMHCTILILLTV